MTLARQLFVGIFVAFFALLVGIEAISIRTSRSYLEEQLDAHANETATSLALLLGTRGNALDASVVNIMVNPVFDRGHFQSIAVFSPDGARIFGRTLDAREMDVPGWFKSLVPLKGPEGEALITSGWTQLGKVVVQVHPGYAYRQLFETALATLGWLAALFALALLAVRRYLAGNFDLDRNAMVIVHKLLPAYIKPSPGFTQQIGARPELRFMLEAMVRMLRPLEIPLIAQGVEDKGSTGILAELGVSGYQGYALGKPEPLPEA